MTAQHDDPWTRARASQRDDVAAVLAPRERRCPACGALQRDGGRICAACGADLTARYAKNRSRRPLLFAAVVALALAAVSIPLIADLRDEAAGERERSARRQAALESAERARLVRDSRPVRAQGLLPAADADPLAQRMTLVLHAETLIAGDARERVADGRIDGPIKGAACSPFPTTEGRRAAEQAPSTRVGRYDCVAYTSKFEAPELEGQKRTGLFGYPYWLVIDYASAKYVWCKVTPRAGEGGRSLVAVPVPEPCRDPPGPG